MRYIKWFRNLNEEITLHCLCIPGSKNIEAKLKQGISVSFDKVLIQSDKKSYTWTQSKQQNLDQKKYWRNVRSFRKAVMMVFDTVSIGKILAKSNDYQWEVILIYGRRHGQTVRLVLPTEAVLR